MHLPRTWSDITIGQYLDISDIILNEKDAFEREIKLISYFRGHSQEQAGQRLMIDILNDAKKLNFLGEMPKGTIRFYHHIKFKKFKVTILPTELTAAQLIDCTTILRGLTEKDYIRQLHYLMGLILVPAKHGIFLNGKVTFTEYEYKGYKETGEWLKNNMSFKDAYPYFVFFCKLLPKSQEATLNYLEQEKRKILKMILRPSNGKS